MRFGLLFLLTIQLLEHLMGTIFYHRWSKGDLHGLHSCCLVYMILGWVFYPLFLSIFITCDVLFSYQIYAAKNRDHALLDAGMTQNVTCCCNDPGVGDCCPQCERCCFDIEPNPSATRYNNSCCCDGCCDCCIDCCIDCCGESSRPLPPGIPEQNIIYLGEDHRVIYMPHAESIPMAEVVPMAMQPLQPLPVQNPVITFGMEEQLIHSPSAVPMNYPPVGTSYTAPLYQAQSMPVYAPEVGVGMPMNTTL